MTGADRVVIRYRDEPAGPLAIQIADAAGIK
jgi:hypothetical protein